MFEHTVLFYIMIQFQVFLTLLAQPAGYSSIFNQ